MKVVLTNLSNASFAESRARLNESARKFGIQYIRSYDFEEFKRSEFYQLHKTLLDNPKGLGFWIWKPYIIQEALKELDEGDVVIYCDAGIEIIHALESVIKICAETEPILLFANGDFHNSLWTTGDCFYYMNADQEDYKTATHVDASFCFFRKSAVAESFITEWLSFSVDERIMREDGFLSGKANPADFIEFRWDQSILSLLAHKYGVTLYRSPSQFGNHYKTAAFRVPGEVNCVNQLRQKRVRYYARNYFRNSPYPQLLDHHRSHTGKKQGGRQIVFNRSGLSIVAKRLKKMFNGKGK